MLAPRYHGSGELATQLATLLHILCINMIQSAFPGTLQSSLGTNSCWVLRAFIGHFYSSCKLSCFINTQAVINEPCRHLTNNFPYLLATSYHEAIYGFHESVQHTLTVFQTTNTRAIANLLAPTNTYLIQSTLINILLNDHIPVAQVNCEAAFDQLHISSNYACLPAFLGCTPVD